MSILMLIDIFCQILHILEFINLLIKAFRFHVNFLELFICNVLNSLKHLTNVAKVFSSLENVMYLPGPNSTPISPIAC